MNKAELIDAIQSAVAGKHELNKTTVSDVVDATFDAILASLKNDGKFQASGFGTFTVKDRKARKGKNPKTGEEIQIPASRTIGFKPAPSAKATL